MAYFDFENTPITEDTVIEASYSCLPQPAIILEIVSGNAIYMYDRFVGDTLYIFKRNGEEYYRRTRTVKDAYVSSSGFTYEELMPGDTIEIWPDNPTTWTYYMTSGWVNVSSWSTPSGKVRSKVKVVVPDFNKMLVRRSNGMYYANSGAYGGLLAGDSIVDYECTFDTSMIEQAGSYVFEHLLWRNKDIKHLPEGSFDTSNIKELGSQCFRGAFQESVIEELPEGSFNFSSIQEIGGTVSSYSGCFAQMLTDNKFVDHLPEGSFRFSDKLTKVGGAAFFGFCTNTALTELPEGSFNTDSIEKIDGTYAFANFNYSGNLVSLPKGSFNFSNLKQIDWNFLSSFNASGKLESLPANSFNWPMDVAPKSSHRDLASGFNTNGALTEGNRGVKINAVIAIDRFNVGSQTNLAAGTVGYVNSD